MKNKELEEKLNKINDELNKINEKLKDSTDTMVIKGMYAKDELDDKIEETKKNLDEAKEELYKKKYDTKKIFTKQLSKNEDSIDRRGSEDAS